MHSALQYTALQYTALQYTALQYTALRHTALQYTEMLDAFRYKMAGLGRGRRNWPREPNLLRSWHETNP